MNETLLINDGLRYLEKAQEEINRRISINQKVVTEDKEVLTWLECQISKNNNQHLNENMSETMPSYSVEDRRAEDHGKKTILKQSNNRSGGNKHRDNKRTETKLTLEDVIATAKKIELQNSPSQEQDKTNVQSNMDSKNTSKALIQLGQDSARLLSSVDKWERICQHQPWLSTNVPDHIEARKHFEREVSPVSTHPQRQQQRPIQRMDPLLAKKLGDELTRQIQEHVTESKLEDVYKSSDGLEAYRTMYRAKKLLALSDSLCEAMCSQNIKYPPVLSEHQDNLDDLDGVLGSLKRSIPACTPVQFDRQRGIHELSTRHSGSLDKQLAAHAQQVESIVLTDIRNKLGTPLLPHLLSQLKELVHKSQRPGLGAVDDSEWKRALVQWKLAESVLTADKRPTTGFFSFPS